MNIRAKLLPSNTATSLTVMAKDLDGNDAGVGTGADEYTTAINTNLFNTSTFTTVTIPLSSFTLATFVPPPTTDPTMPNHKASLGPFGFVNPGDGLRTDFNLYEFGAGVVAGAGLLRMEIDFMEIRLQDVGLDGDFNEDGKVDAADYVVWRKNGTGPLPNDAGAATSADRFNVWTANFGAMSPGGGSGASAVPEPATWLLATVVAAFVGFIRRRR
jgi:hypothetical protein